MKTIHPYYRDKPPKFAFRPRKVTEKEICRIAKLHNEGTHLLRLAATHNISTRCLKGLLVRRGYKVRGLLEAAHLRKATCNERFFEIIDSEEKAYWLGFIAADGCVTKNRNQNVLSIGLAACDRSHLLKFKKALESKGKVYTYEVKDGFGGLRKRAHFTVRSERICRDLKSLKVRPNKSGRELVSDTIPSDLLRHFFRGYIDGDGSWAAVTSIDPGPSLSVLGSHRFLKTFRAWLLQVCVVGNPKINRKKDANIHQIGYTGRRQVGLIALALYKNSTVYLNRKMTLVKRLLNSIKSHPGTKNTILGDLL